jgi:phosphatidate cytidylyltransferase
LTAVSANLAARVATAAIALPLLLAVLFLAPSWVGAALLGLACLVGLRELFGLFEARGIVPVALAGYVVLVLSFAEVASPRALPPLLPLMLLVTGGLALTRARTMSESITAAGLTFFAAAYIGSLGGCLAGLLLLEPAAQGPWRVVLLMAVIMIADTAAYFTGRAFGRRKLAPLVSPGKTVAGALGALGGGIPAAVAVCAWRLPSVPWPHALLLGLVVTVLGMGGDLVESLMKRWAGVKDSGTFFPGHGGMLDRVDSLLLGAPALYYYFLIRR